MKRRRHYLVIAALLASGLAAWAGWWFHRTPVLHFVAFAQVIGKRCAIFTLENRSADVFLIRKDADPAHLFTVVKRESGWDAEPTPAPSVKPGPDSAPVFFNPRRSGALCLRPGDSARVLVPLPRATDDYGLPCRAAVHLGRYPRESTGWL